MIQSRRSPEGTEKNSGKFQSAHLGYRTDSNFLTTSLQCCLHFNSEYKKTEEKEVKEWVYKKE
jgi:hypothetical protein